MISAFLVRVEYNLLSLVIDIVVIIAIVLSFPDIINIMDKLRIMYMMIVIEMVVLQLVVLQLVRGRGRPLSV